MSESMKIVKLKNYGIPSHIVNIWGKDCPRHLLPIQEEAVKNYGILNCGEKVNQRCLAPLVNFLRKEVNIGYS